MDRKASSSAAVVRWLRLMRQEASAFFRSRLTAYTARDGVFSTEQADLTDTHTPLALSARWAAAPRTPATLRLRMWGSASPGLLMRSFG